LGDLRSRFESIVVAAQSSSTRLALRASEPPPAGHASR
jgi:hypothetical protein